MIRRIGLVVSVCLTALLISSCSDGTTKSGVDVASSSLERVNPFANHPAMQTQELTWATPSWATTSSGNAYEGYVNKHGDLLAAFNRVGGSKSNWGKNHYCNYGRREGRTYSGLSSSGCSSTTTRTTTEDEERVNPFANHPAMQTQELTWATPSWATTSSGNAYEGYVNKHGDLLAAFNRVGGSKSNWGKNHYCNYGRGEGRTYSGLSSSGCSSTTTRTANSSTSASSSTTTRTANSSTSASNFVSISRPSGGRGPVRTVRLLGPSGVSYTTIGNTTIGSNGTSYTTIGNSTIGSNGTSYTTIGNSTIGSNGTSYTTIGNTTIGSNGTSCTRIGITTICN